MGIRAWEIETLASLKSVQMVRPRDPEEVKLSKERFNRNVGRIHSA